MAKVAIERRKPMNVFFPITRVRRGADASGNAFRLVEGYAFVNAWVGDGWNLKRSAMVAASDDYMRWGAIREMHQPSAVGTATGTAEIEGETVPLGVAWDERGAFLRSKVVDPDAIVKLDAGVYKGYSVGIQATVMRGIDVETCTWIENSLVDRPADPDAAIMLIRAMEVTPKDGEVLRYYDEVTLVPRTFNDFLADLRGRDLSDDLWGAFYAFLDSCYTILESGSADISGMLSQSFEEFVAYVKGEVLPETADMEGVRTLLATARERKASMERAAQLTRSLPGDLATAQAERMTALAEANDLRAELAAARERVAALEKMPDPAQPRPVRFAPADRQFPTDPLQPATDPAQADAVTALRVEYQKLTTAPKDETETDETRRNRAARISVIRYELRQHGVEI